MGYAIAKGILDKNLMEASAIAVFDISEGIQKKCSDTGFVVLDCLQELCENSEIVVLATTPQQSEEVIQEIENYSISTLLSIVTGMSTSYFKEHFPNTFIVRAMPNTPLQVGRGSTAICASDNEHTETFDEIKNLFGAIGLVEEISEDKFPLLVSVHGSTPAYFYYLVECIVEDLVSRGFDEKTAREFVVETLIGSGELLKDDPDKPIHEFVDAVCSKGGTTIQAINHFKEEHLDEIVHEANEKCIGRAKEFEK